MARRRFHSAMIRRMPAISAINSRTEAWTSDGYIEIFSSVICRDNAPYDALVSASENRPISGD